MRTLKMTLTALGLAALLASPAWAQRGGRGFGFGPGMLLSNKSVQQELKLDDQQIEKAKGLSEQVATKMREMRESLTGLEGQEQRDKATELMKPITEETNKAVAEILKPEQNKRFHQITLQQRGSQAFSTPEIQNDLKLTDEQKEKIKTILQEARPARGDFAKNAGGDREAAREKAMARRKETLDKVLATLTDDQKKAWNEKTGAPFEIKFEPRPQQ